MKKKWLVLLVFSVGACASPQPADTTELAPSTAPSTVASATTTSAPTTTTSSSTTTTAPAPTTSTSATTTSVPTPTTTLPEFPDAAGGLVHGNFYWAVYLSVAEEFDDPALSEATELADSYGYFAGVADINCDAGANVALGLEEGGSQATVGIMFDTAVEASQFVVALDARGHSIAGLGRVQTFCLD